MPTSNITIIKKDGRKQSYDQQRITVALQKAAARTERPLTDDENKKILNNVHNIIKNYSNAEINVLDMHNIVQRATIDVRYDVAAEYSNYRNYKKEQLEQTTELIRLLDRVESDIDTDHDDESKREQHVSSLMKEQIGKNDDTDNDI